MDASGLGMLGIAERARPSAPDPWLEVGRTEEARFPSLDVFGVTVDHRVATNHRRNKLTSKVSRAVLIASLAVGASGLVAVPAEAANGVSTANYYVNNPSIGSAVNITPESAVVNAAVDTGGSPESVIPVPSTGLLWNAIAGITITGEQWNDGTAVAIANISAKGYAPIDGIPASGSSSDVSVTITDAAITNSGITDPGIGALSGKPQPISNAGSDSYSDVTFEYDPVSDYVANGDLPGPETQTAQDIQVPTTAGISSVSTTLGAFGQAAQNNTGNTPLTPSTKYYYWIVQQAGATTQASNINVSAWTGATSGTPAVAANNSYKCYPNVAIAADPTLASYTQPGATVTYGGASLPADQGPCIYYFGNTGGALYYQSPNGTFTTPKLGPVKIAKKATATGSKVTLGVTNASAYKASGTIVLTARGKVAGTAKFSLGVGGKGTAKVKLTAKGRTALRKGQTVKVAPVSQTANVTSTSNWDQPLVGKSVKL
jgi:hypothetical protein